MTSGERLRRASLYLQALAHLGWSRDELAERLGWNKNTVARVRDGRGVELAFERYREVERLYVKLHAQRSTAAGASRVAAAARRAGYAQDPASVLR